MNTELIKKLEAIYSQVPEVHCRRLCGRMYCGPIIVSILEAERLQEKRGLLRILPFNEPANRAYLPPPPLMQKYFVGIVPDDASTNNCVFLSPFGKCRAYDIRPLVCRLWGAVNHDLMRCPFGCVPDRWLSNEEVKQMHRELIEIQKEYE